MIKKSILHIPNDYLTFYLKKFFKNEQCIFEQTMYFFNSFKYCLHTSCIPSISFVQHRKQSVTIRSRLNFGNNLQVERFSKVELNPRFLHSLLL